MAELNTFFEQYLPDTDSTQLVEAFDVSKMIKRKEHLIRPGQNSSFLAFIIQGTFRVYFYSENGIEITVWFSFAGMMITDMLAFYTETRASFYVQAVEESEIRIILKSQLYKLYQSNPEYQEFGRKYAENAFINVGQRMLSFQTKSAEERYKELLQNPKYMQKIPLKYLASYLGVTDTSLSRIRKNLQ